ncbi:hypothetical protein MMC30_004631 [Trapelia coarctata]|nr:hypothetical protein [Trapelia coarctata]
MCVTTLVAGIPPATWSRTKMHPIYLFLDNNPKFRLTSNFPFLPIQHEQTLQSITSIWHDTYPFIAPTKKDFRNKHVFITGASKGIGRATAITYSTGGASCISLSARSSLSEVVSECEAAAQEAGHPKPKVLAYTMDVVDRDVIERTAAEVAEDMDGRLDILINNAGYPEEFKPIVESDPDEWWKTWTANMRGPYLVMLAFLPLMLQGGDKTIVNLSSVVAHRKLPGSSDYRTTKFAIACFTEFIEAEYGDKGFIAFCVHPGGVLTSLASNMPKHTHSILVDKPEMGADTIAFLTAEKREWLNGRYVSCNWDMEELLAQDTIASSDLFKFRLAL